MVRAQGLERGVNGDSSDPLFFRTSTAPTLDDVERALAVLREWERTARPPAAAEPAGAGDLRRESPVVRPASGGKTPIQAASVTTTPFTMRSTWSTPGGASFAIVGVNETATGAGIAAANTAGGTDLLLDGDANGLVDARLTESGLDRPSAVDQVFSFTNSNTGVLSLQVDGVIAGNGSGLVNVDAATLGGVAAGGFAASSQACSSGSYVSGIDANGDVVCSTLAGYVNANCVLYLGWAGNCDGCTSAPTKWGRVRPGSCVNGAGVDNTCQSVVLDTETINLFGLNTDGTVDDDDKFYLGFKCF
jgi:hypothetical protein